MIRVVQFSGGKDSTALVLWAIDHFGLDGFVPLFCDTKSEHPITLAYIDKINKTVLDGRLIVAATKKYISMEDLVHQRGRVPSAKARFCTDELKIQPTREYLRTVSDEVTVFQGIRANESKPRKDAGPRVWADEYDCWVHRPLFYWTAERVFDFHRSHGVDPNPLYLLGAGRVGCFPCINITLGELKRIAKTLPEVWEHAQRIEDAAGSTFFPPNYIPFRFCSRHHEKTGIATVADVRSYVEGTDEGQIALFDTRRPSGCLSVYNLCE